MTSRLSDILHYDSTTRQIDTQGLLNGSSPSASLSDTLEMLKDLTASVFHSQDHLLARELAEWARFRAIFCLLPETLLFGDPPLEKKPIIAAHLHSLGIEPDNQLISCIKCVCEHFQSKRGAIKKLGITDVYVRFPHVFKRVLAEQNSRCCYCGESIAYGENATLDHIWPFHLGDDPTDGANWCFSCAACNTGKGEFPFYSITGACANWIAPDADGTLLLATRYAALARDRKCVLCGRTPKEAALDVRKRLQSGCWILDNSQTVCRDRCR